MRKEFKILFLMVVVFLGVFFMPIGSPVFTTAIDATFYLSKWYA